MSSQNHKDYFLKNKILPKQVKIPPEQIKEYYFNASQKQTEKNANVQEIFLYIYI